MLKPLLIFITLITSILKISAQQVTQAEINTTCFVISELMAEAKIKGDVESVLIYSNAIDKIKERHKIDKDYSDYFDSIKKSNLDLKGIVISLNGPPKLPGFSNNEIDDFIRLKKDGISLTDFNEFLTIKKFSLGKISSKNMTEFELQRIENLKNELNSIEINN